MGNIFSYEDGPVPSAYVGDWEPIRRMVAAEGKAFTDEGHAVAVLACTGLMDLLVAGFGPQGLGKEQAWTLYADTLAPFEKLIPVGPLRPDGDLDSAVAPVVLGNYYDSLGQFIWTYRESLAGLDPLSPAHQAEQFVRSALVFYSRSADPPRDQMGQAHLVRGYARTALPEPRFDEAREDARQAAALLPGDEAPVRLLSQIDQLQSADNSWR